jgi:hypothetical protein
VCATDTPRRLPGKTIQGGYATNNWVTPDPEVHVTTLDAQGAGRVFYVTGQIWPTIAGFHITGGNAFGMNSNQSGGGICLEASPDWDQGSPMLMSNTIYGNTAQDGGGIYIADWGNTLISENNILTNTAQENGGGMAVRGNAQIVNNQFGGNSASLGGGLSVMWEVILHGNFYANNTAAEQAVVVLL